MFRKLFPSRSQMPSRRRFSRPFLESLEDRCVPAAITWTRGDNGDFADAANWTVDGTNPPVHRVPNPLDDATIPGSIVVTSSVNQTVNSVTGTGLRILGGTFTVRNVNKDSALTALVIGTGATFRTEGSTTAIFGSEIAGTLDVPATSRLRFQRFVTDLKPGARLTGAGEFLLRGDVLGGPTLFLSTDITSPANIIMEWGDIDGPGKLTIPTGVTFQMAAANGPRMLGSGITEIQTGATLLLAGTSGKTLDGRTINNAGTIRYRDNGTLTFTGNTIVNNLSNAIFRIDNDEDLQSSGIPVINNAGTFVKQSPSGTGNTKVDVRLNNSGTVRIEGGSLTLNRRGTHTGTFDLASGDLRFTTGGDSPVTLDPGTTFIGTGTVRFVGGGGLTIVANANVSFARFEMTSGATLDGPGTVTFTGSASWRGGTMQGTGVTAVAPGATLSASDDGTNKILIGSRVLRNSGSVTLTGTNGLSLGGGATIENLAGATFLINSDAGLTGPSRPVTNAGTFIFQSPTQTGTTLFQHALTNTGTFRVDAGTVNTNASLRSSGTINLAGGDLRLGGPGSNFDAGSTVTGSGSLRVENGTLSVNASVTVAGSLHLQAGTLTVNAPVTVAQYTQTGGNLGGSETLTVSQSGTFTGGNMTGPGTTVVAAGATLALSGGAAKVLASNRRLDNFGTTTLSNTGELQVQTGSVLTNKAGATFDITSDADLTNTGSFVNEGTLKKSAGVLVTQLAPLTNRGIVRVETGTLQVTQNLAQTAGSSFVAANATLQVSNGNVTLSGGTLSGNGTVLANVTNNGGTVAPGASPGTLTITGTYTQSANGILNIELGGTTTGSFDRLAVSGAATLNGTLNVTLDGAYVPAVGNTFQVMTYASRSGDFTIKNGLNPTSTRRLTTTVNTTNYTLNTQSLNAGTLQFASGTATVAEGSSVTITVTRTGGSDGPVSLTYATSNGTATSGSDYVPATGTLSWADGDATAKTFLVYALTDTASETNETVNLTLSNPIGTTLGTPTAAIVTITDVPLVGPPSSPVQFSAATLTANLSAGSANVTVTRATPTTAAVTVAYATANGSAIAGQDYTATNGTLTFAAGETSKTFTIPLQDDGVTANETILLSLSNAGPGAVLGTPASAILTVNDDVPANAGSLQFSAGTLSVAEGNSVTVTVTRTGGSNRAISVTYATSGGTATSGSDYVPTSGALSWASGDATAKTFVVFGLADSTAEPNETVNVTLSNPTQGATLGTTVSTTVTITDVPLVGPPSSPVQFSAATLTANLSAGSANVTVTRATPTTTAVTVAYATANGSAIAGQDYTATNGTLTFAAGETSKTFTIPLQDDGVTANETILLSLSNAGPGAVLGTPASAILTVNDDVPANAGSLQFSAGTLSVAEGNSVTVTVTRTGGSNRAISVTYATGGGTATSGSDYVPTSGTLNWASGDATAKTFVVFGLADSNAEPNETVNVTLSNPTQGATLGTTVSTTVTITDVPPAPIHVPIQFASGTFRVNRSAGSATVNVTRGSGNGTATVAYATSDGTATAGEDYTATSGTLTFAVGETTKSFTIPILNGGLVGDETILLTLANPSAGHVLGNSAAAVLTVVDNVSSSVARFVQQAYLDILRRRADVGGLLYWAQALEQGVITRDQVARAFLSSPEYRALLVAEQYRTFLRRDTDAGGLRFWVDFLSNRGVVEDLKALLLGSEEYFRNAGGTNENYLTQLYRDLFGRDLDAGGRDFWLGLLNRGVLTRSLLAQILVTAKETLDVLNTGFILKYLRRAARPGEVDPYTTGIQNRTLRDEDVERILVASDEYFARV